MKKHKLIVTVSTIKQSLQAALEVCKKVEKGLPFEPVYESKLRRSSDSIQSTFL